MLIVNGSPHVGGTTDALVHAACQGSCDYRLLAIRDYAFAPCAGCNYCAATGKCRLARDQAQEIFTAIFSARALIIVAPIYFYALPGLLKGFIDRAQLYWRHPTRQAIRPAAAILAAGREKGENLFSGSLLSLKYFLQPLSYTLRSSLLVRGIEHRQKLKPEHLAQAQTLAREMDC